MKQLLLENVALIVSALILVGVAVALYSRQPARRAAREAREEKEREEGGGLTETQVW